VPFEVLDVDGCVRAEPGLAATRERFVGGLRLPDDETGDCHLFTQRLAEVAAGLGVKFEYGVNISSIDVAGGRVTQVTTDKGIFTADHFVAALGSFSSNALRPLGIKVPVYPVKGYSITVPITDEAAAPVSTVMDESYKVAITRMGNRIRVGGTAELSGYEIRLNPNRRATLDRSLVELFPAAGDLSRAEFWSGLRPMTPDGPPIVGAARYPNLFLNTGHGTLGWTMACGAARVLADQIAGRAPEIDADAFNLRRYQ